MIFEKAKQIHIDDIVSLVKEEYEAECRQCPQMIHTNYEFQIKTMIVELVNAKYSYVAMEREKVIGFLGFWGPIEGFFGNAVGGYSPLGGSAFTGENRNQTASRLLSYAMQEMIKDRVTSFALTRFAHDEEIGKGLVMNGYGIRCSDAIRDLRNHWEDTSDLDQNSMILYQELPKEDFSKLIDLRKRLITHLCKAPTCMPTSPDYLKNIDSRINNRVFVAKDQNDIVGFIEVKYGDGENYMTESTNVLNICGTYVKEEYRGKKVAQTILYHLIQTATKEGINYLGVDCETLNPTALRFWGKYFSNYTYSYARRIDEGVLDMSLWE